MNDTPPYEIRDDEHDVGKAFILRSPWRDEYRALMIEKGIEALRLPSHGFGFQAQPIAFVNELGFLRSIEVYTYDIVDLAPLASLNKIEVLGLQVRQARGIDDWRPPLRVLLARWCKELRSLLSLPTLEYINISNYPYTDLTPLGTPNLRRLALTSRSLESLAGVSGFSRLEHVDLYNCPNLESVEELREIASMKHVEVESCRHISRKRLIQRYDK